MFVVIEHVHACMVKDASLLFSMAYDNEFLEQTGCANENAWKLGIKQTRLNLFSSDTRLKTSNPTNGWIPRVKGTVYACIREFQWLSSVPSSMSSSIMDIILFRLFPVSNALYTCRTTWLRSQFDTFDSMFFIQGSNSRYEIPIRKKIIIYRLIEHWESIF